MHNILAELRMKCLILFFLITVCAKIRCARNPGARKLNARKKDALNLNSRENFMN